MNFKNLQNFMDHMAAERTPGNSIVIYKDGKLVYHYASGYSDLENKVPMTGEEMFYIYSCTKVSTAVAAAQMLERGKFLLNEPLYEYIPEFKDMYVRGADGEIYKAKNPITIGNLITMTAGFNYNLNAPGFKKARELTGGRMDTVETIKCVASDPLYFEPGARWNYSICHDVLAAVISVISGQKYRDYIQENIFDPLDIKDTAFHVTPEILDRMAVKYSFIPEGDPNFDPVEAQKSGNAKEGMFRNGGKGNNFILGPEYDSGGAGLITNPFEYAKLAAALANHGTGLTGERILSPYMVDLMRTNRLTPEQQKTYVWEQHRGYHYGLGVWTHANPSISGSLSNVGEMGWGGAAGASMIIDPKINLGVFYVQHCLNPREGYYQPRLRNVVYSCLDKE